MTWSPARGLIVTPVAISLPGSALMDVTVGFAGIEVLRATPYARRVGAVRRFAPGGDFSRSAKRRLRAPRGRGPHTFRLPPGGVHTFSAPRVSRRKEQGDGFRALPVDRGADSLGDRPHDPSLIGWRGDAA